MHERTAQEPNAAVTHWFDFICPFCYVGQSRSALLRQHGLVTRDLGLRIHPEIRPGGHEVGERTGPMYDALRHEAERVGLPLVWRTRIAYSAPALTLHSWLRVNAPDIADRFATRVFAAYFGDGRDIEPFETLLALLADASRPDGPIALPDDWQAEGLALLQASESLAAEYGVTGTPAWTDGHRIVVGLRPPEVFEQWAQVIGTAGAAASERTAADGRSPR
jgi:predicted DsbA family dithiol-disulfide isomerase